MGSWTKIFTDGTREEGSDRAISLHGASWSRGRLTEIQEVVLSFGSLTGRLSIPDTEWHQFDRFVAIVAEGTSPSTRTHRIVQAKITEGHLGWYLVCSRNQGHYFWTIVDSSPRADLFNKKLTSDHLNKWATIVLPKRDYPFLSIASRGKMNDD